MRKEYRFSALILAAGYSSRAPGFKPLLPFGQHTVIENVIQQFRQAGIDEIVVVVGHRADELMPVLNNTKVKYILNEEFNAGMFSSVMAGVRSFLPETEAFFILPVDMPLVRCQTIKEICRTYAKMQADVTYPIFLGKRGHPTLISTRLSPTILTWNKSDGLNVLLKEYEKNACEVDVIDEGILNDIDTDNDYYEVQKRYEQQYFPTWNECEAIWAKMEVPEKIKSHGKMVSDVARRIASQLIQAGVGIDVGLVTTAGLLHDLAKGRSDHAIHGAIVLENLGFPKVAEIVASHTDILFEGVINEAAVVYLADKLVKDDGIIDLSARFGYALDRFSADDHAVLAITERWRNAQAIEMKIREIVGEID